MNKTAILSFIIDEVALKCRNVSSNMRKRIHWMLKYMEITVWKYDKRALILNGWVRVRRSVAGIRKVRLMKKGISNYSLETQEQLDKIISLNKEIRCFNLSFNLTSPIAFKSMEKLIIYQDNYEIFSKCSFSTIKLLILNNLLTEQIKNILTRVKRINALQILSSSLQKIDFGLFRINKFSFEHVSLKEPVYLPREIEELSLFYCEPQNLIKAKRVNELYLLNYTNRPEESEELFKTLRGVQIAGINESLKEYLTSLPSTVRKIKMYKPLQKIDNLEETINQFPYLIDVSGQGPIEVLDKSKIRVTEPIMIETEEKFNLRPRKIIVDSNNAIQLNTHPELFEKVEWVDIKTSKLNFDVLPSEIKRIQICGQVDEESVTLNRLEKERE